MTEPAIDSVVVTIEVEQHTSGAQAQLPCDSSLPKPDHHTRGTTIFLHEERAKQTVYRSHSHVRNQHTPDASFPIHSAVPALLSSCLDCFHSVPEVR